MKRLVRLRAWVALAVLATGCRGLPPAPTYEAPIAGASGAFVVYGDSRPRMAAEVWRDDATPGRLAVIARIAELRPDFALNSGDLVAQGADRNDWAQYDRETAPIRDAGVPMFAGLGNHDLAGDESEALRNARARFPSLGRLRSFTLDEPTGVPGASVRLVVIDTNFRAREDDDAEELTAWLRTTLDAAERDPGVRDVLLVTHHPPFTNAAMHGPSLWVRETALGMAKSHWKVRAIISGHVHSYERFRDGNAGEHVDCIVSGGGGAPLVTLNRDQPAYRDLYDGPRGHNILVIRTGPPLTIEAQVLTEDGRWEVVDRIVPGRRRFFSGSPH
ncbi:MAG: metallophosphoesterase [Planctomycetes bacterium]|nr:metallophosphoesterase [Planctomycetota bacterium]